MTGTTRGAGVALRLATFNLLHGFELGAGPDGRGQPAPGGAGVDGDGLRRAAFALDADVVGLQEVDRAQPRSYGLDQTLTVAHALGAEHHRYVPALAGTPGPVRTWTTVDGEDVPEGPSYGVGLVSRLPVRCWAVRRFPASRRSLPLLVPGGRRPRLMRIPDEPRVGLAAVVETAAGPVTVITAHLSFVPGTNAVQLRVLARWALRFPAPRVLIGDFNLPGSLPRRLTHWEQLGRVATYPSYRPRVQFDHALADGLAPGAVRRVQALRLPVSDHCALVLDLVL